jgi:chemotaxis protein methyltransferase CheR
MDDRHFARLLRGLGRSWRGYRKVRKGVKRRVARHMQELHCPDIDSYLAALASNLSALSACEQRLGVSISRFFRDLRLWEVLADRAVPEAVCGHGDHIRLWFIGCACGEEVYSFKILWVLGRERGDWEAADPRIVATDKNLLYLEKARAGVYAASSLREVSAELRQRFFFKVNSHFAVKPELKKGICWKPHGLLDDPLPAEGFHMIFLRNSLLTYYQEEIQAAGLCIVVQALVPGGFLVIGNHERLPDGDYGLIPYERSIYRKSSYSEH